MKLNKWNLRVLNQNVLIVAFEKLLYTSLSKQCTLCKIPCKLGSAAARQRGSAAMISSFCSYGKLQIVHLSRAETTLPIWQAESSFNTYRRYQHLKLLISAIRFADIDKSHCWYPQFELSISATRIVDIEKSNFRYPQFELQISTITIFNISNAQLQQYQLYTQFER